MNNDVIYICITSMALALLSAILIWVIFSNTKSRVIKISVSVIPWIMPCEALIHFVLMCVSHYAHNDIPLQYFDSMLIKILDKCGYSSGPNYIKALFYLYFLMIFWIIVGGVITHRDYCLLRKKLRGEIISELRSLYPGFENNRKLKYEVSYIINQGMDRIDITSRWDRDYCRDKVISAIALRIAARRNEKKDTTHTSLTKKPPFRVVFSYEPSISRVLYYI